MKAARYFEQRLVHSVLLLIVTSMAIFGTSQLAPGSFVDEMRLNPQISPQTMQALRMQFGVDQPLPTRYFRWLRSAAMGDFGYSLAYNLPVAKLLWSRLRNTLLLGTTAMLVAWTAALLLGSWSTLRSGKLADRTVSAISAFLLSTPELALALLAILLAARFRILPAGGMTSIKTAKNSWEAVADVSRHLILPMSVLALTAFPVLFRHLRAAMLEVWNSSFVHAARGHGISDARLLVRHAVPAALSPMISLFGFSVAALVSGSFLVEVVTAWPGIGPLFLEAIYARDLHLVVAVVMLFTAFLILANLTADLLLYAADPRVRSEC
ncbi:MAG TPA: ABC transporter permease [Terriglobales bacterium]|nr:ABC transporter permease [Terriglobales bacterium]